MKVTSVKAVNSRHLVIAGTFSWNRLNHSQTLIEKPLDSGHFYSRQLLQQTQFFGTPRKVQAKFAFL